MDEVKRSVVDDGHVRAAPGKTMAVKNGDVESITSVSDVEKQDGAPAATSTPEAETTPTPNTTDIPPLKSLSFLDRFLVIWILLAMGIGILIGNLAPSSGPALQRGTFVGVSIPIAIGLLVMMYPILCKVRYEALHHLLNTRALWVQIGLSFVLNWLVCPLLMTGLAWAFLPDREDLREGLIFVGIARCIAMVLVWTELAGGDGDYCAVLVAFNSLLQIVLFAPFSLFFIRVVSHDTDADDAVVNYGRVSKSVAVFLGIPLAAAILTRLTLRPLLGPKTYTQVFLPHLSPLSLLGLLYTITILFISQGAHVVHQITSVLRILPPLLCYFLLTFTLTLLLCKKLGFAYRTSAVQGFTAASNNFELAIAVAVGTWGVGSGQALAASVGPLVEVPVLVGCVYLLRWVRGRWGWEA